MAVALPGLQNSIEGDTELFKENNKQFVVTNGNIELEVNKVRAASWFNSAHPSLFASPPSTAPDSSV
jgi:hypothetical protein